VSSIARPGRPKRKQVLTDLRRQEILAAAVKVFGRKGFAATCVDDIAASAGIAKGTLYLYFESKEDIYATAVQSAIAELQALAEEQVQGIESFRERLAVAIRVRIEFWDGQKNLYRLLLTVGREPRHRAQTHKVLLSGQAHFLAILKGGRKSGAWGAGDFEAIAWTILDMVRGASERRMDKLTDRTPAQDAASITELALRQLGAAKA
jgi:AcrR family transcriptional regulator